MHIFKKISLRLRVTYGGPALSPSVDLSIKFYFREELYFRFYTATTI